MRSLGKVTISLVVTFGMASPLACEPYAAIEAVANRYLIGQTTGQTGLVREVTLQPAGASSVDGNTSSQDSRGTVESWPTELRDGSGRARIADVTVDGAAATVKIELESAAGRYTEYLSLVRVEGRWKIANKLARRERFYG